jgi:putative redox protein
MAESVIVRQNRNYELEVLAIDPHDPEATEFVPVDLIYQMTPYTMLLVSAAACTAIVVHTYAEYHAVPLEAIELQATYDRVFQQDCEQCEALDEFEEVIDMHITFSGQLSPADRHKLFAISRHCPIEKMLMNGIPVRSHLAE